METFRRFFLGKSIFQHRRRRGNLIDGNTRRWIDTRSSLCPGEIRETKRMVSRPARCNGNERWPDPSSRQCAADSQSAARHVSISQHVRSFGGSHRSSWNDSACQSSSLLFFRPFNPQPTFIPDNFDGCFWCSRAVREMRRERAFYSPLYPPPVFSFFLCCFSV